MSLNMYLGEVRSQTQSMNAVCTATIQGMEQAIQSIDAFATDTVLQGQTYSSAKAFFVQTFRPLAQGIIYLCEELIRQNNAFPSQFQSQVAQADVIEQEVLEQIREIDRMKTSMEAVNQAMPMPGMDAMVNLFIVMRQKLQEKLDHLYQFNQTSSNNYSTALQLATSIAAGLAEVQSGIGFSVVSGTFSTQGLNMDWIAPIQKITEKKTLEADKKNSRDEDAKFMEGSVKGKEGKRIGFEAEGSIMEKKSSFSNGDKLTKERYIDELSTKAIAGQLDVNIPYDWKSLKEDVFASKVIGLKGEAGILDNSYKFKSTIPFMTPLGIIQLKDREVTVTQKIFSGEVVAGIDDYSLKAASEASTLKYEVEVSMLHFPDWLPIIGGTDLKIKGDLGLGAIGLKGSVGKETGITVPVLEGFTVGSSFKFEKPEEKK
ncbi:T7SS effector LXG polymorphic toxin [Bacillus toyonensis]|uniref:T7SS effector LXG polymorphic toxin n=1 Tax=Bacillus toyonensis TaxID=155322 RepID=UPI000CD8D9EA|nr:T7SS effector LXG polymorphic toxin [Bacillus toyonensis]MED3541186.1 T7SS effector LXG polymorphic toxin [Bacillus toyonensis]MEE2019403.1 T7SS effector LXG polymorphic toxin [Bacillus toyonensis]